MPYTPEQRRDWRREQRERREETERLTAEAERLGGILAKPEGETPIVWVKDPKGIWRGL